MRERKQKPSPRAKPSYYSTRQAWCLTWLPQLQTSQNPHCSQQWQIPLIFTEQSNKAHVHAPLTYCFKLYKVNVHRDHSCLKCTSLIISLKKKKKKNSTHSTTPHLTIVITFKWKISRGMQCTTARCQQPTHTHGIGQIESECHHKSCFHCFHWAQGKNM